MNDAQIERIADAIRRARTLEPTGAPANRRGGPDGFAPGQDQLLRASSVGADLRNRSLGRGQVVGASREGGQYSETDEMKRRLVLHALIAISIILAAMAFQIVWRL